MTITEQIHKEFDEAQEVLLAEAKKILEKATEPALENIRKNNELLEQLGFKKVPSLEKSKKYFDKLDLTKEELELVQDYKKTYPFLRFLTVDQLNHICEKYNLIHAAVDHYIKEVPTKNLEEIANAPSLEQRHTIRRDTLKKIKLIGIRNNAGIAALGHPDGVFTQQEIRDLSKKYYGYDVDEWTSNAMRSVWLMVVLERAAGKGDISLPGDFSTNKSAYYSYSNVEITEPPYGLHIAAPKSHFDLEGLSKTSTFGFGTRSIFKVEPPDPVVFRYVKGGIQVLSKWGEEGNDPLLQVDITN